MRGFWFIYHPKKIYPVNILYIFLFLLVYTSSHAQDTFFVYFENGSSILSSNTKKMLDSLAYNNILQPSKLYTVTGHADVVGGESANNTLSVKRAETVARYLVSFGVKIDTVFGNGEIVRPETSTGYPMDRRVDIVVTKKAKLPDIKTLKKGDVFDLENMFFHGGMAIMKQESMPVLEMLLKTMQENKTLKIRIEGHVHCYSWSIKQYISPTTDGAVEYNVRVGGRHREQYITGSKKESMELSTARAKVVRDYLVQNKIDATRLQYAGLACKEMELHPDNNRRVAIRILEK